MKKILIVLLLLMTIIFTGCSENKRKNDFVAEYSYYYDSQNIKEKWTWFNLDQYKKALELKRVIKLSFDEVQDKINKNDSFVIYYGFNPQLYQCPYCVETLPIAIDAFNELNEDFYYLDIYAMRSNNTEEYLYLYNQLVEVFNDFGPKILAPTYVYYQNGKPIKYHAATFKNDDGKFISGLNETQKQELKLIYKDLIA